MLVSEDDLVDMQPVVADQVDESGSYHDNHSMI